VQIRNKFYCNTVILLLAQAGPSVFAVQAGNEAVAEMGTKATAPPVCIFSSVRLLAAENMTAAISGQSGATIAIKEIIDQTSALLKPATINLAAYAVCNMPHQLTVTSTRGALLPENPGTEAQGLFLKEIHYRATARWGAQTVTLLAGGGGVSRSQTQDIPTARAGDLALEIRVDGTDNDLTTPVMEGQYSDNVRFIFGPQP
jgi:hypothetical protein